MPEETLIGVIAEAARSRPDHPWVIRDDERLTYADAELRSSILAAGLASQGVATDDTVLVMLTDSIDALLVWIATARLRAIDVPVNIHYRGDILVHVVNDSAARTLIVDEVLLDRFVAEADRLPMLERVIVRGAASNSLPWSSTTLAEVAGRDTVPPPVDAPRDRDLMSVMYTSGTTGPSKGVMIAHAHAYHYASATVRLLEMTADDVVYSAGLPLFHVAGRWGVFLAAAIVGATVAMPPAFSASTFWQDVRRFEATKVFLLGAMGSFLASQQISPDDRNHPLRKAILAPLLPNPGAFADRFGIRLAHAFGATEFNTPILLDDVGDATDPAYVGKVRGDLFDVAVVDEDDREVPDAVVGEIVVRPLRPWIITLGYWRHPEWTAEAWRNLWFHTGDLGRRDPDGNFYFLDRKKDSIRRRGENISSMEVEGIVARHGAVAQCAVFPVASAATEQEVMVTVVLKPGAAFDLPDFIRSIAERMPHFMVPRYVDIVPALPMTPTGKVQKAELRVRGITASTWDREVAGVRLR